MKVNVAVLYGGKSTEHEVSVISALQAMENIDKEKYEVIPVYMDKTGDFYYNDGGILFDSKNYSDTKTMLTKCVQVVFVRENGKTYIRNVKQSLFGKKLNVQIDVAFPIVHGTNVEDGNLQGYLHTFDIPFVGPDCLAAALSMDKYVMKEYVKCLGVPVIDAIRLDINDFKSIDKTIEKIEHEFKYPVIVKPINLGSSIGIKKAKDKNSLREALELAFTFSNLCLVEKAIENLREINCAVLGDKYGCECSALEEPFGNDEILSFADKYMSGSGSKGAKSGCKSTSESKLGGSKTTGGAKGGMASLQRKVPADIDNETAEKIRSYSKTIFKYLGCSGVSRIDYIIDKDDGKIYANEINSIPGSLSFYLFEPLGMPYKELLDKLIKIAINDHRYLEKLNFVFENNLLR